MDQPLCGRVRKINPQILCETGQVRDWLIGLCGCIATPKKNQMEVMLKKSILFLF